MQLILFMSLSCFLCPPSSASSGTQGASFLNIPVGARPAAMGSAYTALATDAYAPIWNPAGLGFVNSPQLAAQHLSYLESVNYEQASYAQPLGHGRSLGASLQYLGTGDIPGTDPSGAPAGNFSSHFVASSLAYGQKLTDRVAFGLTGKWINAKISDVSASAYAFDLGTLYHPRDPLTLAATLTNVGNKLQFLNQGDSLPMTVHVGAAYRVWKPWLVSVEGVMPVHEPASGRAGIEWSPMEMVSLRAGYRSDSLKDLSPLAGFSTGVGLRVWGQEFSYAWVPYGDLGDTQYFSLLLKFGGAAEERRNLIQYHSIKQHRTARSGSSDENEYEPDYEQLMQLFDEKNENVVISPKTKGQQP